MQPWHAQNGVVATKLGGHEGQRLTISADTHRSGGEETRRGLLTSVSQGNRLDQSLLAGQGEVEVSAHERGRDEVTSGTTIQQEGGGVGSDGSGEFNERTTRNITMVDVRGGG